MRGCKTKNLPWGGVWIYSGTTRYNYIHLKQVNIPLGARGFFWWAKRASNAAKPRQRGAKRREKKPAKRLISTSESNWYLLLQRQRASGTRVSKYQSTGTCTYSNDDHTFFNSWPIRSWASDDRLLRQNTRFYFLINCLLMIKYNIGHHIISLWLAKTYNPHCYALCQSTIQAIPQDSQLVWLLSSNLV